MAAEHQPSEPGRESASAAPAGETEGRRLRFVSVELERLPGSRTRISVTLDDAGETFREEAEAVGGSQVELRLAARATLSAIGSALGRPDFVRLVGLKQVHAFDADIVLVAVRTADRPGRRLVGAVPVEDDPCRTAAVATLDAVNRVLSRDLPKE